MSRSKQQILYVIADFLAAMGAWVLFCLLRENQSGPQLLYNVNISLSDGALYVATALYICQCFVIYYFSGYYLKPLKKDSFLEIITTLVSSCIVTFILFVALLLHKSFALNHTINCIALFFILHFGLTYILRCGITQHRRTKIRQGHYLAPVLIIGTGSVALKTFQELRQQEKKDGLSVVGFISTDNQPVMVDPAKILGAQDVIPEIIAKYSIEEFFVSVDNTDEKYTFDLIQELYKYNKTIKLWPRLYEILTGRVQIGSLTGSPFVNITDITASDWAVCCKRGLDVVISLAVLVLFSPLYFYIALRIKLDSAGPVFYMQERIGLHGHPFRILKFRTMKCNSENGIPMLSSDNDERITRYGRKLRKYRLDELPQFFNILKGDMSIVGPRPERRYFIDRIAAQAPYYYFLYKARPGLASWGPIRVGYTDTMEKMIERLNYDIVYLENMSLVADVKILFYTVSVLARGKGV